MTGNGSPDDLDYGETIRIPRFGPTQKIFRRYTLQKILGRGGMGVVWLARDDHLETLVALKVLPEALTHDPASLEALKQETKLGLQLAHPNIVRIFDFQQDDNAAAISMEYIDGVTLSDVRCTRPEQVFNSSDLAPHVTALCDALNYAHTRRKIVHRDLKPRNLMLNSDGELKIADFGISRSISESMVMVTGKLSSTGSPPYISPQQWDGDHPSPLDDIYSVGATLYELLTSKPPLLGVMDWQKVHFYVPPPMWERRNVLQITGAEAIPLPWEETIAACLAKDPKDRPQTIMELQARLANHHVSDAAAVEVTPQALSDDIIVIPKAPSAPNLEVPAAPLVDPKLTMPAPPLTEPKEEATPANIAPSEIEELSTQAKAESPLAPSLTGDSPSPPAQESRSISPAPSPPEELAATLGQEVFPETATQPSPPAQESRSISPAPSPPEELAATLGQEVFPETATQPSPPAQETRSIDPAPSPPEEFAETAHQGVFPETSTEPSPPAQESRSISPAPSPPEEFAATRRQEVFPETATEPSPRTAVSPRSPRRIPRWVWATAGAAIFVLFVSFFIWRKQPPPATTSSSVESPRVQSTPSITGFTLVIDSVGESAGGKQLFLKHVRASINGTAVKLKGDGNHWNVDFGAHTPPLPFDLKVSAPGYQPTALHFENIDDLKNPGPLRLVREHGTVAFHSSGAAEFTKAQLKMVETLPEESEDVVVDSSTIVKDLSATTPLVLPTGVYEVAFQSRNKESGPTMRVAVHAGALQPVDVPKTSPAIAAKGTPHATDPPVSVITTNETSPPANNPPAPVLATRVTPAPAGSPAIATAKETPAPANVPPAPVNAVKEPLTREDPSALAEKTQPPQRSAKTAKQMERKTKGVSEPPRPKVIGHPPSATPKSSSNPVRKKAPQPFENGVPGG